MGYFLPWDPNADKIKDQVYQNEELNTLMQKYQENSIYQNIFYEEEKRDKLKAHQEELLKIREKWRRKSNEPEPEPLNDEPEPEPLNDEPLT